MTVGTRTTIRDTPEWFYWYELDTVEWRAALQLSRRRFLEQQRRKLKGS